MGMILVMGAFAGLVLGSVVTAIAGGVGVVLAIRCSRTRARHWRVFTGVFLIILPLCLLGVHEFPLETARPGADYDITLRNFFLQALGFSASPGVAAILAAVAVTMTSREATPQETRARGSGGTS